MEPTSRAAVVLGMGGCVDYEIHVDASVLQGLAAAFHITDADLDSRGPINTERDLVRSVLGYLRAGTGGEHFVRTTATLESFASRFDTTVALGGTSVRAGIVMARLGVGSLLHLVSTNDHVRTLLPDTVDWISSNTSDTLFPHLILQYPAGLRVRTAELDLTASSANRLIYVNDPDNDTLALHQDLGTRLRSARVLLLSGFNAIRDARVLATRLAELRVALAELPEHAFVYFEDAAFHEPSLGAAVHAALMDRIDVFSMNEDELRAHLGRPVALDDPDAVAGAILELHELVPARNLVVHTSSWSAVHGPDADELVSALELGMGVASLRFTVGDEWTPDQLTAFVEGPRDDRSAVLADAVERSSAHRIRCRPGFRVSTERPTTVGLGDSFVGGFLTAVRQRTSA